MKLEILHVPGAVAANTNIDLPATYPKMAAIIGGKKLALTEGTPNLYTVTDLIVAAPDTLTTGQIARVDKDTYKLGDDTLASEKIELIIIPEKAYQIPT